MKFSEIRCPEQRSHTVGEEVFDSCGSFICAVETGQPVVLYARCNICGGISLVEFDGVFAKITKQKNKQDFERAWRIKNE